MTYSLDTMVTPDWSDGQLQGVDTPAFAVSNAPLSEAESNRRRVEREFLSVCATNPPVGLGFV